MRRATLLLAGCLLAGSWAPAQRPEEPDEIGPRGRPTRPFPGAKDMRDEIMKAEHAKSIKDAEQLMRLSQELRDELEKNTRFVLSLSSLKKTEEIEKIAKRIRNRMQR